VATTQIIAASDRTGHFAYARGKTKAGEDLHRVGFGSSKEEAQRDALAQLAEAGGSRGATVIYNYFSHGRDSAPHSAKPAVR
jgi:hypothetical protein